jgi:hypothetical protein
MTNDNDKCVKLVTHSTKRILHHSTSSECVTPFVYGLFTNSRKPNGIGWGEEASELGTNDLEEQNVCSSWILSNKCIGETQIFVKVSIAYKLPCTHP